MASAAAGAQRTTLTRGAPSGPNRSVRPLISSSVVANWRFLSKITELLLGPAGPKRAAAASSAATSTPAVASSRFVSEMTCGWGPYQDSVDIR